MVHVLEPSLPPGAHKSEYAPFEQRPRTRDHQASGKEKARGGDKSGSNELMHVLQNAFESNWSWAARSTSPRAKKPAKEIVVVVDGEDEEEGEKEAKANLPNVTRPRRWSRRSHSTHQILT